MHDATADANRGALIDGRSEFTQAVRRSLAEAHRQRLRELCFVDTNFEVWPLDDAEVLDSLSAWARLPQRRLLMVGSRFDTIPRLFSRFTAWRGTFAHVVEAFATEVEPSQVPTLLLAVNLSGTSLSERSFLDYVLSFAEEPRVGRGLCFEITGNIAAIDQQRATRCLDLRGRNVQGDV